MLKRTIQIVFIHLALLITTIALADTSGQIQANINHILKQYSPNLNVGIVVQSLTNNKILYQKNAHQLLMPASTLKILPAVAALSFLGPNYRFHTKILTPKIHLDRGMLSNDIYVYFDGDPSLTHQNIDNLIKTLAVWGLKTIRGTIYIDDTSYDDSFLGTGWVWDDLSYCGAAPISAIMINKNCLILKLIAGKSSNQPATLVNAPSYVSIINDVISKNLRITDGGCAIKLQNLGNNYYLSGCVPINSAPQYISVTINNVRLYAKNLLLTHLQENGIKLLGSIEFKKAPNDVPLSILAEHQSAPLSELIKHTLKKSDNTYADAIYKKLGFAFFSQPASWENSNQAIKNILETKTKTTFKEIYMDDGSGVSRYNLITPTLLVTTLNSAYNDTAIRQIFINSLSKAGIDGTLKYRLPHLKNRLYAKTGNMVNSSSLAGYIKTKNQGMLAFVIIINSFLESPKKYHALQDKICNILANS